MLTQTKPLFRTGKLLDIIYQDDALLVANKPAGLLAVPGRGDDKQHCLSRLVQHHFPTALVVHRLDMSTSGLMLFALGADMQTRLSAMFRDRAVQKLYVAVVSGRIASKQGEIDLPLNSDWPNRPRQRVDQDKGKPSLTRYRLLEYDANNDTSRLELEPVTGRTHQLRVHLAAIGHPIQGDTLYLGRKCERLLLHAHILKFIHPVDLKLLHLSSPVSF